jgi:hypothetical protein
MYILSVLQTTLPHLWQLNHHMAYGACQLRVRYTNFSSIIVALPAYKSIKLWKHYRREEKGLPVI